MDDLISQIDVVDVEVIQEIDEFNNDVQEIQELDGVDHNGNTGKIGRKCQGFRLLVRNPNDVYTTFPFTLIPEKGLVFENGSFHHKNCLLKNYLVFEPHSENRSMNQDCFNLQFQPSQQKMITNMHNTTLHKTHVNNHYLSHKQMELRPKHHKDQEATYRLKVHSQSKTIARLNKTLDLHQRFLHSLQEHRVHRLHDLVNVALKQGRSVGYILQKVTDAVDGIYQSHYNSDDKDLAFVILQFGGPALLDIIHRVIGLPSPSTVYKMIQGTKTINSSVNASVSELGDNMQFCEQSPRYGCMLKIDEHYVDRRARWCPNDNKLYGVCYDHSR